NGMKKITIFSLPLWLILCGFNFPNEKKFLAQKVSDIEVFDAEGKKLSLFSLLDNKPLIIAPIYTKCYTLCGLISNGVQTVIKDMGTLGEDFTMVSFSFDSTDSPADLKDYESRWKMDGKHWKSVSASPEAINHLMKSIDYQYDPIPNSSEYNHPSILIVLTPSGRISRYIYGINPSKKDIKLAVIEAMSEKTRPGILKGFYLRCFGYDPVLKTYKMDWRFIISTSAGLLIIGIMFTIFLRTFIISKNE
ncbi:MAG TPA: SCO family protein, partial [Flavipsychrobacter sp.]|nr:SCO family protein [Flavipsychrobacter sp.]